MFLKRFIFLTLIALLLATHASAQTPAAPETETKLTKEQQEEAQKKLTAQALELLDVVVKDAERLTLPENRLYASIAAADLLWEHDAQKARLIFKNAVADLRAVFSAPDDEEQPRAYRQKMVRAQMREKLIFALARHDARLARDLMAETRPPASQKNPDAPTMEGEEEFEIRLAAVVATHDPAQALEMAQKSLAKGFSASLPNLITEIQKQDAEAAAKLTSDILTKLKTTKLTESQEGANLAFRIFIMATDTKQAKASGDEKSKTPLLSEQSLRELAELVASTALNAPPEVTQLYMDLRSIMPQLEKYAPARAQQLKRKNEPETGEGVEYQTWREFNELTQSGTADEILAAAEKATPHMRESYYRQAAFKLVNEGKSDRARQVISEHVTDPQQRQQMLSELDKQILATAAEKGKLEETRKFLASARTNEERIMALAQLAMSLAEKGDKKTALVLLEEARGLSSPRGKYSRQLLARMQIARGYAQVDPAQSLLILESAIDQLNDLIAAGILLGEFFAEEEAVKDDELVVQMFIEMVDMFQAQYGADVSALTRADFARTRDAAEKFQRPEIRLLARLLVAQSALIKPDEKKDASATKANSAPPVATQTSDTGNVAAP